MRSVRHDVHHGVRKVRSKLLGRGDRGAGVMLSYQDERRHEYPAQSVEYVEAANHLSQRRVYVRVLLKKRLRGAIDQVGSRPPGLRFT